MFEFKKKFGQNFLTNQNIIDKIIEFIPKKIEYIYEIGPGFGALTEKLNKKFKVTAIEIDQDCIDHLQKLNLSNTVVVKSDVLRYKFEYKHVIGNLPYNIASKIITNFVYNPIPYGVFMVQKEMAENIKGFSRIGCFIALCYDVQKVLDISAGNFNPAPKVTSSIIVLKKHDKYNVDLKKFDQLLLKLFAHRRKSLSFLKHDMQALSALEKSGIDLKLRIDQLKMKQIIEIYNNY